jgi:uncharacterized protein involved in outer membrane biogenesis
MPETTLGIGITVLALSGIVWLLLRLADINRHKDKIASIFKKYTGRSLQVQDRIRLSVIPWAGVNLGKVRVGNAKGFEEVDFADIQGVKVRVKFMPVLAGRVVVDTIRLERMDVNLMRKPDGVTNWDDLLKLAQEVLETPEPPAAKEQAPEADEQDQKKWGVKNMATNLQQNLATKVPQKVVARYIRNLEKSRIMGLDVKRLNLTFDDQLTDSLIKLGDVNMKTSEIGLNRPVQVQFKSEINARNIKAAEGLAFDGCMEVETKVTMQLERALDPDRG